MRFFNPVIDNNFIWWKTLIEATATVGFLLCFWHLIHTAKKDKDFLKGNSIERRHSI